MLKLVRNGLLAWTHANKQGLQLRVLKNEMHINMQT
jgi:hypothetical protein